MIPSQARSFQLPASISSSRSAASTGSRGRRWTADGAARRRGGARQRGQQPHAGRVRRGVTAVDDELVGGGAAPDLDDAGSLDTAPEALVEEQLVELRWCRAKAVGELFAQAIELLVGAGRGDVAVDHEAQRLLGDEALWQPEVEAEVQLDGGRRRRRRLAAQLGDRLLEQVAVGLEADRAQVAVLLGAEQVAGAADLEVARGDAEAGAEVGELDDRRQPLARLVGERALAAAPAGRRRRAGRSGPTRPRSW